MHFLSTRGGAPVALSRAIIAGPAPDGGLYVPANLPSIAIDARAADSVQDAALEVLAPFFANDALAPSLADIVTDALDFPTQIQPLDALDADILELFHGPTAAFKDYGARFLAAAVQRIPRGAADPLTILVATSGDTGAAVAAAFHRRAGFRVVILYPDGRVSPRQAHQLGAFRGNVAALRVAGTFDDCQRLVRAAFADAELVGEIPLASANSIGIGRLLPQMSYYVHAAVRHREQRGEPARFIVPTGNLGNAFAAMLARAAGAPIDDITLACNANRTLPDWLASGVYQGRAARATLANAMDVGDPSNTERVAWLYGDAATRTAKLDASSVDDAAIRARIRATFDRTGYVLDPHTACAAEVLARKRKAGDARRWTLVGTAHPAKFAEVVEPLVGAVEVPRALAALLARSSTAEPLAAEYERLRERLRAG